MKTALVTKAALLALTIGVSAAASADSFNYNYIEGGFGELDGDGDAFFVNGARDINKDWGVVGGIQIGNYDLPFGRDADQLLLEGGLQFHQPLKSNLGLQAGAKLLYVNIDSNACGATPGCKDSDSDIGLVGNVGLRFQVQPKLQLEGEAKLTLIDDNVADDGLGLQGNVRYYFDPRLSLAGGVAIDTELDGLFINLRYEL